MIASENLFPLKQYLSIATNTCPCTKRFSLKYVFLQSSFPEEILPIKKVFPYFFFLQTDISSLRLLRIVDVLDFSYWMFT